MSSKENYMARDDRETQMLPEAFLFWPLHASCRGVAGAASLIVLHGQRQQEGWPETDREYVIMAPVLL